ncbi:hypothetical protein UPYG_G00167150 [Umbra pygmaea]|uniref:Uncharacterized protein n=1 Tax=Umbra pygmaea TaxID=75934 RepID=A0ABD0X8U4_UMBPY
MGSLRLFRNRTCVSQLRIADEQMNQVWKESNIYGKKKQAGVLPSAFSKAMPYISQHTEERTPFVVRDA